MAFRTDELLAHRPLILWHIPASLRLTAGVALTYRDGQLYELLHGR